MQLGVVTGLKRESQTYQVKHKQSDFMFNQIPHEFGMGIYVNIQSFFYIAYCIYHNCVQLNHLLSLCTHEKIAD